jgi:hypothetical protein
MTCMVAGNIRTLWVIARYMCGDIEVEVWARGAGWWLCMSCSE